MATGAGLSIGAGLASGAGFSVAAGLASGAGFVGWPTNGAGDIGSGAELASGAGFSIGAGLDGEIAVKSPANASCYLDGPDASALSFQGQWVLTGDIGRLNHQGQLFALGRKKRMVNVAGKKVAPAEVEACLRDPRRTANEGGIRIPRSSVYFTLLESHGCVASNQFLNWRADSLLKSCTSLVLNTDR